MRRRRNTHVQHKVLLHSRREAPDAAAPRVHAPMERWKAALMRSVGSSKESETPRRSIADRLSTLREELRRICHLDTVFSVFFIWTNNPVSIRGNDLALPGKQRHRGRGAVQNSECVQQEVRLGAYHGCQEMWTCSEALQNRADCLQPRFTR